MSFLPVGLEELNGKVPDFVVVTGDAYVDHPSFGAAIIGRVLESKGFLVAVLAQPDWRSLDSFRVFGKPRLGFLVTGGNIDSMVNHYTVAKKKRSKDMYSPEGKVGLRPDRASIVYGNKIRECYKDTAIVLGGLEASLRRMAHYDYWDNRVRNSILVDSGADILVYGMGETQMIEIAEALDSGLKASEITFIRGTVCKMKTVDSLYDSVRLPDFSVVAADKRAYAQSFMIQYENTDAVTGKTLVEGYRDFYVVQNPPALPISESMFDYVSSLPYERTFHPIYSHVPAIEEVRFSLISSRGCFGSCHFCALAFHQGRVVQGRSHASILREAEQLVWEPDFKGYIHDVGGPTANFRKPACQKQLKHGVCKGKRCLSPSRCESLEIDHSDYLELLRKLRRVPKVKKVFVRSGIRFDYLLYDKDDTFFKELVEHHISGQLKVAPEHVSGRVLQKMGKPGKDVYDRFVAKYLDLNEQVGKKQFLVPYLMSGHPGSDLKAAVELAEYLRDMKISPEQVQDFYPTPGTLSTCMFYTGLDPRTLTPVYVTDNPHEKAMQRALIQYRLPQNYHLVHEALTKANRTDLIGFGEKCLIRPKKGESVKKESQTKKPVKKKTIRNIHKKKTSSR